MASARHLAPVLGAAHDLVRDALHPGALAVDATVGNGHDTLMLADAVGPEGTVLGFDVQAEALHATRDRLRAAGVADRVRLIQAGHETLLDHLPDDARGAVQAVTFNLGYLPGAADKSVITRPDTTLAALEAATEVLGPGGMITIVLYTGHPGGPEEADAVRARAQTLDQSHWAVLSYQFVNQRGAPPALLAIERLSM
ncbi:MAG: methyltransferase domain-containing protein [Bacteroidetes bacterium]|jgi:predicted methyltransferase|nr:methyltransferase domain-containing protein [Bacteroidota bacterium]